MMCVNTRCWVSHVFLIVGPKLVLKTTVTGWLWSLHHIPHLRSPVHGQRTASNQWSGCWDCPGWVRNSLHRESRSKEQDLGLGNIRFSSPAPTSPEGAPHSCFSPLSTCGGSPTSPAHAPSALGDPSGSRGMGVVTAAVQEGSLWTCAGCWADWKFQKDPDDQVLGRESQPSLFTTSQETSDRKTLVTKGPSNRVQVGKDTRGTVKAPNLLLLYQMKNEGGHVLTRVGLWWVQWYLWRLWGTLSIHHLRWIKVHCQCPKILIFMSTFYLKYSITILSKAVFSS